MRYLLTSSLYVSLLLTCLIAAAIAPTSAAAAEPAETLTGVVSGTVTGPDGKPLAGAEVGLAPAEPSTNPAREPDTRRAERRGGAGPVARSRTDADGKFTFTGIAPGSYRVQAGTDSARGMTSATVKPGTNSTVKLALQEVKQGAKQRAKQARQNPDGEFKTRPAPGERHPERLRVGDDAPDFTLPTPDGKSEIALSKLAGRNRDREAEQRGKAGEEGPGSAKPVVLVFGSFTCPPFRDRVLRVQELYESYKGGAEFLMVYIREAHPDSVIRVKGEDGKEELMKVAQTSDFAARADNARLCSRALKLSFPAVVDKEDNRVNAAYAGWPSRIVVVDRQGKIAFDGGPGPAGFQPADLEQWLKANAGNDGNAGQGGKQD